ncbi:MAG: glycosyltransferase family 2 protein [Planctomycetota bacterium]
MTAEPPRIPGRPGLSACIIAMDEEDRIAECLESLSFCDEIVVVDSHSKDRTREIAAGRGARVIERDWPGHVAQKEFAIRAAAHDWVLCVDADERISAPLRAEIEALRGAGFPGRAGWRFRRLSSYLGRWMRRGAWVPDWQLRLFDRRRGRWGGNDPHDHVVTEGPVGDLEGRLLHHPYRDFAEHLRTIDRYTTIMAEGLHARGVRAGALDLVFPPAARFLRAYVFKLGFLEGWRGFLQACLAAHYGRMKYAKLLVLQRGDETRRRPA